MQAVKKTQEAKFSDEFAVAAVYDLSPLQEGMLFHSLQAPESGVYVQQMVCRLPGTLQPGLLRQAWEKVVERHEALRAAFVLGEDDIPRQNIFGRVALPWLEEDLTSLGNDDQQKFLREFMSTDRRRGFDLQRAPLMRFVLRKLSTQLYHFVWSYHHLLLDGWSSSMILREVLTLYGGLLQGVSVSLPPPVPYSRYIEWLRRQSISDAKKYWAHYLEGLEGPLNLSAFRPARNEAAADDYQTFKFDICSSDEVKQFTRRYRVTLSTLIHGVWALVMGKYCGQQDVTFGSIVSCRPPDLANSDSIVGMLINTVPVRVTLDPAISLGDWMPGLQRSLSQSRQYDYCRLTDIQSWSRIPANRPFLETFVLVENFPPLSTPGGGQSVKAMGINDPPMCLEQTNFPLGIEVESGDELSPNLHFNSGRIGRQCVGRLAEHYRKCFETLLFQPEMLIGEICLLTDSEWKQIISEWSGDAGPKPFHCIHELFAAQVRQNPGATAVVAEETRYSYEELNRLSNRLAHYLRALGVGPEAKVGICLERHVEAIVALLAVLKTGGAYVPLDPAYPSERLLHAARDSGMKVLLSRRKLAAEKLQHWDGETVWLDEKKTADCIALQSEEDLKGESHPEDLAYVIYTSGSTGKAKGVMVPHCAVCNVLLCLMTRIGFSTHDRMLWTTTLAFDIAALEVFMPLMSGGTVLVGWDLQETELSDVMRKIAVLQPNVIQMTPAGWRLLISAGWQPVSDVTILCGGEALDRELATSLLRCSNRVWNVYGPSETTIWSAAHRIEDEPGAGDLASPVSSTQFYILDQCLEPVPVGVPGELHIGGTGLARGYQNRPDLTAERFIPNRFSSQPGERLYKTGDLGAWLVNGDIEFLGRIDHQVKIHGFRIELGEIENALMGLPEVEQAVVVVREHAPGRKQLVAYVVVKDGTASPGNDIFKRHLRNKLPEYMIPGAFVRLTELPLTVNGKIDRARLPLEQTVSAGDFATPRTGTEEMLAGIWEQVLTRERVGRDDNFFEIGGHSLSATLVISRVRRLFGVELPFRSIFENPTIALLARAVRELQQAAQTTRTQPLVPRVPKSSLVPLSFAQQRLWFLAQLEPENTAYNLPTAMRLQGRLDVAALEWSFQEVVRRHEVLRTRFIRVEGEAFQEIHDGSNFFMEFIDFSGRPKEEAEEEERLHRSQQARAVFDLERSPLLRVKVLRVSEGDHILLVTMHHIVSDAWSMGVLVREIEALYTARREGRESPLPELEIQYADYAVWQRQWLQGEVLDGQLQYWRKQLEALPILELPTDYPRPAALSHAASSYQMLVEPELANRLRGLSRAQGVTLFMTLAAAYQVLLARYSGQYDIAIGTPVANRNREETEKLIGFFVNILVLRVDLSGFPDFRQLLERVRTAALGAYAHQDIPFEKLVEEIDPQRHPGRSPFFQARFIMQNTPDRGLTQQDELQFTPQETGTGTAPDDLGLYVREFPEQLGVALEFSTDLFTVERITRMLRHWEELLKGIVASPECPISELPLLTQAERHQLLEEWNNTGEDYPKRCIHELFEEQAARTPDAPAVTYNDRQLTYSELNRDANRLANFLRKLDVGPEIVVGLYMERSLDVMIAIVGILKAGGAYLPLDPAHPVERLTWMLENAQVPVIFTQKRLAGRLPSTRCQIICVDSDAEEILKESSENLGGAADPENLAYIIYTSGSTGEPKGVMISHRGIGNLAWANIEGYQVNSGHRHLQYATLTFDASVAEWSTALLAGAQLVLADRDSLLPGGGLEETLRQQKISHVILSPSVLSNMQGEFPDLETLIVAGEACSVELASDWAAKKRFINAYGPTEVTVCASMSAPLHAGDASIGTPIANTQVYILDEQMELVPVGVPGELYVGGVGLARGYARHPALTAEKFVPNDFSAQPGARLYRTGDVVRCRADGNLEYIGRRDEQIKLRGIRIETGEIEAALMRLANVNQAVVVLHDDPSGAKKLVGYLLEEPGNTASAGELRRSLYGVLPDYMVPAALVFLPEFPLTSSGKVDRKILRAMPVFQMKRSHGDAPRDAVEEQLVGIWRQILKAQQIGIDDDFFELGGHSMLTVKLMALMEEKLHVDLPLSSILSFPTVRGLAEVIRSAQAETSVASCLTLIREGGPEPPLYLVHPGSGQILCYRAWSNHLDTAHPVYALQDPLLLGGPRLQTVEELAGHYLNLIAQSYGDGPYLLAGWSFGALVAFEMAQRLNAQGKYVGLLALADPTTVISEEAVAENVLLLMAALELDLPVSMDDLEQSTTELRRRLLHRFESEIQEGAAVANRLDSMVDMLRLRTESSRLYDPRPYQGKISLLLPNDPIPGDTSFERDRSFSIDFWKQRSAEPLDIHFVPGDHYTMGKEPHVRSLAGEINIELQSRNLRENAVL